MPKYLYEIEGIDLTKDVFDQEAIRQINPQRGDMEQLNGIVYTKSEDGRIIGYKDVKADEFWVAGHIPGRPLFPGVLMIEAAAQLASFYTKKYVGWEGFIGFGGVEECKFRQTVTPGCRLYMLGQKTVERHGRIWCKVQGIVNEQVVFDVGIIGVRF